MDEVCYEIITLLSLYCSLQTLFFVVPMIIPIFADMKTSRLQKSIKALTEGIFSKYGRRNDSEFRNPRRYRLDFIAENTFNRVWTISFSRVRVIVVSLLIVAAISALMFVIVFFSPIRKLLPGRLEGNLRSRYVEMAMRLDSLEQRSKANDHYIVNLRQILSGNIDSVPPIPASVQTITKSKADSMLAPSEAERQFVNMYEATDRFNLSVLTPIAAEGMVFYSPVPGAIVDPIKSENSHSVSFTQPDRLPVSAIYRGTVVSTYTGENGLHSVIVQHPNDFISIYSGLTNCFTAPGAHLSAGESLGLSGSGNTFTFELWHSGSPTDPSDYIGL